MPSDTFLASSSIGGTLDRELAVRSVNPTEPYEEAESIEARFRSVGLSAIEVELRGAGEGSLGLSHSNSKFIASSGSRGFGSTSGSPTGVARSPSPSRGFSDSLRSLENGSCDIWVELGGDVASGVDGTCRGDSKTEDGIGGVGMSSGSLLSAACASSRFEEADCDLLRPKILVILLPKLEAEPGGGTVGDLILASDGRPSGPKVMLLTIGGGAFALYDGARGRGALSEKNPISSAVANR